MGNRIRPVRISPRRKNNLKIFDSVGHYLRKLFDKVGKSNYIFSNIANENFAFPMPICTTSSEEIK